MNLVASRPGVSWFHPAPSRRMVAFLLAVLLPLASAATTSQSEVLKSIPFGFYFISIAVIALFGGLAPSLVAVVFCVLFRNWFVGPTHRLLVFDLGDFVRVSTLFVQALLVSFLGARRRRTAAQLESALATLQDQSQALVDSLRASKCACWILDLDSGKSARWYSGSYEVFGRPFEELERLPSLRPLLHPEDQPRLLDLVALMRQTDQPVVFEHRVPWPNGELHHLEMRGTRIPGSACVWRGVTVDITERKIAESTLLRQEKLAAMGRLASTVAHEINNPLEAVTNLLFLVRADRSLSGDTRAYLNTAEFELARLADITRLTLGFVRSHSLRRSLPLESVVDEVLSIFRHRYEMKNIRVDRLIEPNVQVYIAPHELRQILTNLISNATDALSVSDHPRIAIHIRGEDGKAVFLLEDNGSGIPSTVLPRIFDPFFTTKADVGTGIGLWVTRELVENNGGFISAESGDLSNGMKTRFRLELPLAPDADTKGTPIQPLAMEA